MRLFHWLALLLVVFATACTFATAGDPEREPAKTPRAKVDDTHLSLGAAVSWGGLTVWPVIDARADKRPSGDYTTLARALAEGTLAVKEMGSGGSVPQLMVHNTGKQTVLLTAGEVLQGGQQDRVLVKDVVLPPSPEPVPVAVNCVEQGRWSPGATGISFGYGGRGEVTLTRTVQAEKSQGATWATVAQLNAAKAKVVGGPDAAELAPSSGTYMASLDQETVRRHVEAGLAVLEPGFAGLQLVVGLVVAVDGKVRNAELYGHPSLFDKARADTLRGAALEAVSLDVHDKAASAPADQVAVLFLREALTAQQVAEEAEGAVVRKEQKAAGAAAYWTEDVGGHFIHLTAYAE